MNTKSAHLALLIIMSVTSTAVLAQDEGWVWHSPLPQGNWLNAVSFVDPSNGWAVGSKGSIIHTADGGETWAIQQSGTEREIVDVSFVDAQNGWAVSASSYDGRVLPGSMLRTIDGGANWSIAQSSDFGYAAVHFVNASTGCVLSDHILCTADAGATWTDGGSWTSPYTLGAVHLIDAESGWIIVQQSSSGRLLLLTTDRGQTWSERDSGTDERLNGIHFVDAETGWTVGRRGTILKTTDGGETWEPQQNVLNVQGQPASLASLTFNEVFFSDAENGWIVLDRSNSVFRTADGGATWRQYNTGASWMGGIHFVDENDGWAVGEAGDVRHTSDGGANWEGQTPAQRDHFQAVGILDHDVAIMGWVPGRIELGKTAWDGTPTRISTAWGEYEVTEEQDEFCSYAVWSVATKPEFNNNVTWLAAVCGDPYVRAAMFLQSTNKNDTLQKGAASSSFEINWELHQTGTDGEVHSVFIADSMHWWAAGTEGLIRATTDGGTSWTQQDPAITIPYESFTFRGIYFTDPDNGWIVGDEGTILHTSDGGQTWSPQSSGVTIALRGVRFFDALRGFVVGPNLAVLRTTDGGETWVQRPTGAFGTLYSIAFADEMNGWAVGQGGLIVRTTDGGDTWAPYPSPTANTLLGVAFENKSSGWAVGAYGTILRFSGSETGTSSEADPRVPAAFSLEPNYPNPFNPRTAIPFTLETAGHVRLQVLDVLGRLVETLVDEARPAGEHVVVWQAESASSGVYLYRLQSAGRSEIRIMTVIR